MALYQELFLALHQKRIQYLVAGGFAVNFHQVQRATVDLDLIIHLEDQNVHDFLGLMSDLGFKPGLPVDPGDFANRLLREQWIREKNLTVFSFISEQNPYEVIDVFTEEPRPFAELKKNRMMVKAFGIEIPVVGLKDLIEMKKKAGRDRDLYDINQLKKLIQDDE